MAKQVMGNQTWGAVAACRSLIVYLIGLYRGPCQVSATSQPAMKATCAMRPTTPQTTRSGLAPSSTRDWASLTRCPPATATARRPFALGNRGFGGLELVEQSGKLAYLSRLPVGDETGEARKAELAQPGELALSLVGERDKTGALVAVVGSHRRETRGLELLDPPANKSTGGPAA